MRPRKRDRHLPPCVYLRHGAYYLVRKGKWEPLGRDLPSSLAEYARRIQPARVGGMQRVIADALEARRAKLSKNTWAQYQVVARKLAGIFAEFEPHDVLPRHIAEIRQAMSDTPNMGNRLLSVLRIVFDYALDRGLVDSNPAIGIRRMAEVKRTRLLSAEEFAAIRTHSVPRLRVIIDLLYLTGQRVGDVLRIRYADIGEAGITFAQQKTGARLTVKWSPELRAAVEQAKGLYGNVRALTLLHNRRGKVPDYRTTRDQWERACKAAGVSNAHLHDIRAMSLTAAKRQGIDATALAGMRPGAAIALAFALLLSACTSPHAPERDGVWTTVPREQVRCERRADGVVCWSERAMRIDDTNI